MIILKIASVHHYYVCQIPSHNEKEEPRKNNRAKQKLHDKIWNEKVDTNKREGVRKVSQSYKEWDLEDP